MATRARGTRRGETTNAPFSAGPSHAASSGHPSSISTTENNMKNDNMKNRTVLTARFLPSAVSERGGSLVLARVGALDAGPPSHPKGGSKSSSFETGPFSGPGGMAGSGEVREMVAMEPNPSVARPSAAKRLLYSKALSKFKEAELLANQPGLGGEAWAALEAAIGMPAAKPVTAVSRSGFNPLSAPTASSAQKILGISQGFREDVINYIDSLDRELDAVARGSPTADAEKAIESLAMERFFYSGVLAAWHLAESIYLHQPSFGAPSEPLPSRLMAWLNAHFPLPPEPLAALQSTQPLDTSQFWQLLTRNFTRGNLDIVQSLFSLLLDHTLPQNRASLTTLINHLFAQLESRPHPTQYKSASEYSVEFARWKDALAMASAPATLANLVAGTTPARRTRSSTVPSSIDIAPFSTLLKILGGDAVAISGCSKTWHESLLCSLYWSHPLATLPDLLAPLSTLDSASLKPIDSVLRALLLGSPAQIAASLGALEDLYPAAHLISLLSHSPLLSFTLPESDESVSRILGAAARDPFRRAAPAQAGPGNGNGVREFLILSYAEQLASSLPARDPVAAYQPDPRLLSFGYLGSVSAFPVAACVLERLDPMDAGHGAVDLTARLARISEILGLGKERVLYRTLGSRLAEIAGREADAFKCLLLGGASERAGELLARWMRSGVGLTAGEVRAVLDSIPRESVLPPNLEFYLGFVEFRSAVSSRNWRAASLGFAAMFAPSEGDLFLCPRPFRIPLLRAAVPLLEAAREGFVEIPVAAVRSAMLALTMSESSDLFAGTEWLGKAGEGKGKGVDEVRGVLVECLVGCGGVGY